MLTGLRHLALEVKYLDRAREFYEGRLDLSPARTGGATRTGEEVTYRVGETSLILRRPSSVPRGGLHVHFAFATGTSEYDDWLDRLDDLDPAEHSFGSYRSLYVDDPDGHCVEIGSGGDGPGLSTVFEVVLEVADLEAAAETYATLGFEQVDRGTERRRVRLRGPFDLELWEPQLGLADARGGVHVDLGLKVTDPGAAADAVATRTDRRERVDGGIRVRDPDCHYLTFYPD